MPGGGSSKLNDAVQRRIVEAIKAGNYASVAARYAGIAPRTFRRWMVQGASSKGGKYRTFHDLVRQAQTFAEIRAVAILQKQMEENWRAAIAYLERKFPNRWHPRHAAGQRGSLAARGFHTHGRQQPGTQVDFQFSDADLAEIGRILEATGRIDGASASPPDASAQPLHPPPSDAKAGRVPAAARPRGAVRWRGGGRKK